jgi:peptidoglycan/LPS O-acetylase OafA/YrhL
MSQPPQRQRTSEPRLRPTNPATLLVVGLATAALAWILISHYYGDLPDIPWLPAFTLFALAIGEAVLARTTKARIDRRPGAAPVEPLAVARYAVLAKASSLAGAIFTGFYAGLLVYLLAQRGRLTHASADVAPTAAGVIAALALVVAGLLLERACRVPKRPEDDEKPD